jgi:DNA replication protein DnaC
MDTKQMLSEQVIADLQDFAKKPQGFVLMVGKNGRGKSYAAMHIYEQVTPYKLPARDYDVAWFINQAELNIAHSEQNDIYGSSANLLRQASAAKLFVLDDLGTRTPSASYMDFLYAVIDKRWNLRHLMGTIITTNLGSSQIRKDFSDAIFSRIASGRNYIVIGEDRRFGDIGF